MYLHFPTNTTSNISPQATLIFSSNPNLTMESCIEKSLYEDSYHQSIAFDEDET